MCRLKKNLKNQLMNLPIQDAASDFSSITFSSTNCGKSMALNPKTVPMLKEAIPETIHAAKYYIYIKMFWKIVSSFFTFLYFFFVLMDWLLLTWFLADVSYWGTDSISCSGPTRDSWFFIVWKSTKISSN